MQAKDKKEQDKAVPVQPNVVAVDDPRKSEAFQAFLIAKAKRREVYKHLADS